MPLAKLLLKNIAMICFKSSKWACLNNWSFLAWIFHTTTQSHNSGYPSIHSVNPTLHSSHQHFINNKTLHKRASLSRSLPILYGRMSQKVPEDWFSNATITQESFLEVILMSEIILSFSDLNFFKEKKTPRYLELWYLIHICETIQFSLPESG